MLMMLIRWLTNNLGQRYMQFMGYQAVGDHESMVVNKIDLRKPASIVDYVQRLVDFSEPGENHLMPGLATLSGQPGLA